MRIQSNRDFLEQGFKNHHITFWMKEGKSILFFEGRLYMHNGPTMAVSTCMFFSCSPGRFCSVLIPCFFFIKMRLN